MNKRPPMNPRISHPEARLNTGAKHCEMSRPQLVRATPAPPAAYMPHPVQKVLQAKAAAAHQPARASQPSPVAPPVYRPQPTPRVLQRKADPSRPSAAGATKPQPTKPTVFRPQLPAKVLQAKLMGGAALTSTAIQLMEEKKGGRRGKLSDRPTKHGGRTKHNIEKNSTGRLYKEVYSEEGSKTLHQVKASRGLGGESLEVDQLEDALHGTHITNTATFSDEYFANLARNNAPVDGVTPSRGTGRNREKWLCGSCRKVIEMRATPCPHCGIAVKWPQ